MATIRRCQLCELTKTERHLFKFMTTGLVLFFAIRAVLSTSNAQNATGFISIDCGSDDTRYEDPDTGLIWLNDFNYTKTGSNGLLPNKVDSKLDNSKALRSFRYFPNRRNKHCYDLPVSNRSVLILIRAMFFHDNSSQLPTPILFDVSVNANTWFTVNFEGDEDPIVREGIFHTTVPVAYFCLRPKTGVPFISSLELRPLDPGGVMYEFDGRDDLYLYNLLRLNTGPSADAPTVRYPDDNYDRLWVNANEYDRNMYGSESNLSSRTTSLQLNNVPIKVMSDSWDFTEYDNSDGTTSPTGTTYFVKFLNFSYSEAAGTAIYLQPIFYFEPSGDEPSNGDDFFVEIMLNGKLLGQQFNVTNATAKPFPHMVLPNNQASFKILTTSPVICAIEFYEEVINDPSKTGNDLSTVNLLKEIYDMEDWQGDPCVPVPYDWLGCQSQNAGTSLLKSINSVTLSNLSSKDGLFKLTSTDLSSVINLSLTNSQINDTILDYLIDTLVGQFLQTVNFDENIITKTEWLFKSDLTSLSLSHNLMRGEVPAIVNTSFTNSLQQLNLSYNALTSFPSGWGNISSDDVLESLITLDLSYNNISSDISGLSELVQRNLQLENLYLSDNLLGGLFPSNLYFDLKNIKILNVDRNAINGVLDLTIWRDNMLSVLNKSSVKSSTNSSSASINQVFSFVDNKIIGINPSIADLDPITDFFLQQQQSYLSSQIIDGNDSPTFNKGGVLLGGNPFCKSARSRNQQYLCRSSLSQIVPEQTKKKSNKALIILASFGVAFLLICSAVVTVVVWKYLRELRVLQSIEYALVQQNVQPRFYSYSDLRHATQDFHDDNILGKGGFGIVYKGILEDSTPNGNPIAVKKLFDSAKSRVLNEFLNEVVLISGIKHRNLVQLTGCCIKEKERILVYEFAEGGNVADALWGKGSTTGKGSITVINWNTRYNICLGVARGLAYLHEELQPRIIHRDIKAANILLDKNANPKIGDFGLAKPILMEGNETNFTSNIGGTRGYIAPEHATQGQLTEKADVFSFGILVLEIISGRKCLDLTLPEDQIYLKTWVEQLNEEGMALHLLQPELRGSCPEDEVLNLINIAIICVQFNPKSRPKMSEVITMMVANVDMSSFLNKIQREPSDSYSFVTIELDGWSSTDEEPSAGLLASSSKIKRRDSLDVVQSPSKIKRRDSLDVVQSPSKIKRRDSFDVVQSPSKIKRRDSFDVVQSPSKIKRRDSFDVVQSPSKIKRRDGFDVVQSPSKIKRRDGFDVVQSPSKAATLELSDMSARS